jgi:hypothetical protein
MIHITYACNANETDKIRTKICELRTNRQEPNLRSTLTPKSIRTRPGLCHRPLVHFECTPMTVKARFRADMSIGCFCGSVPSVGILLAFDLLPDLDRREEGFLSTRGRD